MTNFIDRSESIKTEEIDKYYVASNTDSVVLDELMNQNQTILVGSRGVGKSFLMKKAINDLKNNHKTLKVLPVYVSFNSTGLIVGSDEFKFRNWMLARILHEILRAFRRQGYSIGELAKSILGDNEQDLSRKISSVITAYENSYKAPESIVDSTGLPSIGEIHELIEDLCNENDLERITLFIDEAAHAFRPEQQRQFFSLFRDLRSPYLILKAAVYPGVTFFGPSFDKTQDANFITLERDINTDDYLKFMEQLVFRQLKISEQSIINRSREHFNTLAFCANGNPRKLLATLRECELKLTTTSIDKTIKEFYRNRIWNDHTQLGRKYQGHKNLIDWGRDFVENAALPLTEDKNKRRKEHNESTVYFWLHKDAPKAVQEALRLLEYGGLVYLVSEGIRGTGREIGNKYGINFGCVLSSQANPSNACKEIKSKLKTSLFTEFGKNSTYFKEVPHTLPNEENDQFNILTTEFAKTIDVLNLTDWAKSKLRSINLNNIEELVNATEEELQTIHYVGEQRARQYKNTVFSEVYEYISG